jgi:integrase
MNDIERLDFAAMGFRPLPWADFRMECLACYEPPLVAKSTRARAVQVLNELTALGPETTADLKPSFIARYIANRPPGQSTETLRGLLRQVSSFCSIAEKAGWIRISPFRQRTLGKWVARTPLKGKRHFSIDEIRAVLTRMLFEVQTSRFSAQWRAYRTYAVTAVVAYCGLRKNEALGLRIKDLDLVGRLIHVRPHANKLKTDASEDSVPMPKELVPILDGWLKRRMEMPPVYTQSTDCEWLFPTCNRLRPWLHGQKGGKALDRLRAAAERAGVKGMTFQALRVSWATHAEFYGLGPAMISRILRSSEAVTKRHYRRPDIPNLVKSVEDFHY